MVRTPPFHGGDFGSTPCGATKNRVMKNFIPRFGKFGNTYYQFIGVIWFERLIGVCTKSQFNNVIRVGEWVNLPEYHTTRDKRPQFKRI